VLKALSKSIVVKREADKPTALMDFPWCRRHAAYSMRNTHGRRVRSAIRHVVARGCFH